jgi:hypothetical protein
VIAEALDAGWPAEKFAATVNEMAERRLT